MTVSDAPKKTMPKHRIFATPFASVYPLYTELEEFISKNGGDHIISHAYPVYDDTGEIVGKEAIDISFWDLHDSLKDLSDRKREAVFYNVILDWKQKDVAEKMKITTVSVGQYVEQAMLQLAKTYVAEAESSETTRGIQTR